MGPQDLTSSLTAFKWKYLTYFSLIGFISGTQSSTVRSTTVLPLCALIVVDSWIRARANSAAKCLPWVEVAQWGIISQGRKSPEAHTANHVGKTRSGLCRLGQPLMLAQVMRDLPVWEGQRPCHALNAQADFPELLSNHSSQEINGCWAPGRISPLSLRCLDICLAA